MKKPHTRLKIGVLDDHPYFLESIRSLLEDQHDGTSLLAATDPLSALETFPRAKLHVILVDLKLPKMSGIEFTRRFRERDRSVKIIWVSGDLSDSYLDAGRRLGVLGFINKQAGPQQTLEAIQNVVAGREYSFFPREPICHPLLPAAKPVRGGEPHLSPRQQEVLRELSKGKSAKEAADALTLSQRTVENHLARARGKLAVNKNTELLNWAHAHGL